MHKNNNDKITLKDIINACTFKCVKKALLRLYPNQIKFINNYKAVFQTLKHMKCRHNKEMLVIDIIKIGNGKNSYFDVSGIFHTKKRHQLYALEFVPWSKWLGYEINKPVLEKMPKEEIAAHCLSEMTYMGFTQNKIRNRLARLKRRLK